MIHRINIKQCYLVHILEGKKTFEVRYNDRDYQVGDTIVFLPLEDKNYNAYEFRSPIPNYEIIYMTDYGTLTGYVVLGIKEKV